LILATTARKCAKRGKKKTRLEKKILIKNMKK
jgi:hypothetical protein